jgi:hypothetical protein
LGQNGNSNSDFKNTVNFVLTTTKKRRSRVDNKKKWILQEYENAHYPYCIQP